MKPIWRALVGLALLGMLVLPPDAPGIEINNFSPARHNRFASGYPSSPTANPSASFIGAGYDWSGVGWLAAGSSRSYALLSPNHFLYATHYPPVGSEPGAPAVIQFSTGDGQVHGFTVGALSGGLPSGASSDLAIGTFTEPIPDDLGINTSYSILFLGYRPSAYVGLDLLQYGWGTTSPRIGWNEIRNVFQFSEAPGVYYYDFLYDTTTPDRARLVLGDSGSPSFIVTGAPGEMYLAGAHYANYSDGTGGVDSMLAFMLPAISAYMARTGYLPEVVTPITATWLGSVSANWGQVTNWSPKSVPGDTYFTDERVNVPASVLFDAAQTTRYNVVLNTDASVTSLTFTGLPGAPAFSISGTGTLTIGEAGLRSKHYLPVSLGAPIALRTSQRWDVGAGGLNVSGSIHTGASTTNPFLLLIDGSGPTTFSGLLYGTGSLAKHGAGTLTLSGTQHWADGASIFLKGGTLKYSLLSTPQIGLGNSILVAPGATLELAGSTPALGDGVNFVDVLVQGTFWSYGTNQQAGHVTVAGGTMLVQGDLSLSSLTVGSGVVTIAGDVTIGGGVNVGGTTSALDDGFVPVISGISTTGGFAVVPEPTAPAMLLTAALPLWFLLSRGRGRRTSSRPRT